MGASPMFREILEALYFLWLCLGGKKLEYSGSMEIILGLVCNAGFLCCPSLTKYCHIE